ncbi:MAG: ABC transporter permease [Gammaproteobacteria bacterium]|nr:ABC transporter permease [Gammaproteobacteria bacterium]CAJ2376504.1 MAG: ABC transporter permease [Arenicellales bacterium IbO2]MDA7969771.1 ABC transporter permease [Gammaproteobacteria bacterium]MDA7972043.1 ABC transporter permease [Gammaproteobacteria bacterium]MDA7995278.1 ABC transporter permease [Gammaproteobacteria bacterium]
MTALHAAELRRDEAREKWMLFGLAAPAAALVVAVIIVPVGWLFWLSLFNDAGELSADNYARMLASKSYTRIFTTTFKVSLLTTALCVLLGYPLAYFLAQLPRRWAALGMMAVLLPFWTSLLVRTYAWLVVLQRKGLINQWGMELGLWDAPLRLAHNLNGTLIGMAHIMLPFLVLPLYAAMKAIDADYIRAAANLGAAPASAFRHVFFPLSLPGLFAGVTIVFVLCLGFFVTPAVLGGGKVIMVSMKIETLVDLFFNFGTASALGVVLLALTLLVLFAAHKLLRLDKVLGGGA